MDEYKHPAEKDSCGAFFTAVISWHFFEHTIEDRLLMLFGTLGIIGISFGVFLMKKHNL